MVVHSLPGFHDPFSAVTHLVGAGVFGALYGVLIRRSWGDPLRTALLAVYAFSCVLLLSMSGVYHMLSEGTARSVLQRLDMAAIFVLIAGTHTPVQGLFFQGIWRWGVLALMWVLVATGITLFSVFAESLPRGVEITTFLILGWIAGTSGIVLWRRCGFAFVRPLVLGGLAYSVGAVLLGLQWPTILPGVIGPHELWHVAVLIAVSLHWVFMHRLADLERVGPPSGHGAIEAWGE